MTLTYKTRKHQFNDFAREFVKDAELKFTPAQNRKLHALIRDVAMCAAIEERYRTTQILNHSTVTGRVSIYDEIVSVSTLNVLGYKATK